MRIAAIGDLHCRVNSKERVQDHLREMASEADVIVLAGDLTDTGQPAEMEILCEQLQTLTIPVVAVLGNHDHESGKSEDLVNMLASEGVFVLDGSVVKVGGVGFAGTKGFCGGFGDLFIQPFGEQVLKAFIQTSLDEAVRLENALAKLDCESKVGVLHYAPITGTLKGEALELYPFLGCSRLENAFDRRGATVIFHGHAHHGYPEGQTSSGIPVYNVARFVQDRAYQRSYCIFDIQN